MIQFLVYPWGHVHRVEQVSTGWKKMSFCHFIRYPFCSFCYHDGLIIDAKGTFSPSSSGGWMTNLSNNFLHCVLTLLHSELIFNVAVLCEQHELWYNKGGKLKNLGSVNFCCLLQTAGLLFHMASHSKWEHRCISIHFLKLEVSFHVS